MSATYERTADYAVCLSDEGMRLAASDREEQQRLARVDRLYVEIRLGALGGALLTIAGLIVKQLLGV
jgi:hypothetical protein